MTSAREKKREHGIALLFSKETIETDRFNSASEASSERFLESSERLNVTKL